MTEKNAMVSNQPPDDEAMLLETSAQSLEFAATLRAWRLARSLTQDELAAVSGVSKSSISMAERAFHRLPPKEITQIKLAKALGITLRELRQMPSGFEASAALRPPAPAIERNEAKGALPVAASQYNERELSALQLPSKWLLGATDDPESLSYFVVSDASMQPTIKAGDIAIIEPTSTLTAGLLLIGHHDGEEIGQVAIRRVIPTSPDKVRISCDNERFDRTIVQTKDETTVLGRVLFVVRATELE